MVAINWPEWLPLRSDLKSLSPYGAPQIADVIALNTNENPNSLPAPVVAALLSRVETLLQNLNRYPDRDANSLRQKLADYIVSQTGISGILAGQIWAANGSNEILQTLFLAFGGKDCVALGFTPSYSVHPLIAQITGTSWVAGARRDDYEIDLPAALTQIATISPTLIFVTTPNNPTGTRTSISDIEKLAQAAAACGALLVVDEAYAEFSEEPSAISLIGNYPQVVVSRTMSKAFAFAGVRLGYLIADSAVISACLVTRLPYHLSALTQAAAEVALEHADLMQGGIDELISERGRVAAALSEIGLEVQPSSANFLLFGGFAAVGFAAGSPAAWQQFLDRGILIRDVGMVDKLRVTIGTPTENDAFLAAAKVIFAPTNP
jgi:histidinol-phosphate aminotransferase